MSKLLSEALNSQGQPIPILRMVVRSS